MLTKVIEGDSLYQNFNRQEFHNIPGRGGVESIDNEIAILSGGTIIEKDAYIGALLMDKAVVSSQNKKPGLFTTGRIKLETELASGSRDVIYHALSVVITAHALKIVKYRSPLAEESRYIRRHFGKLSRIERQATVDYIKTSGYLISEDFKTAIE